MHKPFRVTHPFHPLFNREFGLIEYRNNWGEDRVYFHDAEGQWQSILASCTDVGGVDPFVEIAAGRSFFVTRILSNWQIWWRGSKDHDARV